MRSSFFVAVQFVVVDDEIDKMMGILFRRSVCRLAESWPAGRKVAEMRSELRVSGYRFCCCLGERASLREIKIDCINAHS